MYNKYSAYNEQNVQEVQQVRRVQSKWIDESLSFKNLALHLGFKSFFATFPIRALLLLPKMLFTIERKLHKNSNGGVVNQFWAHFTLLNQISSHIKRH